MFVLFLSMVSATPLVLSELAEEFEYAGAEITYGEEKYRIPGGKFICLFDEAGKKYKLEVLDITKNVPATVDFVLEGEDGKQLFQPEVGAELGLPINVVNIKEYELDILFQYGDKVKIVHDCEDYELSVGSVLKYEDTKGSASYIGLTDLIYKR